MLHRNQALGSKDCLFLDYSLYITGCTALFIFSEDLRSNATDLENRGHGEVTKVIEVLRVGPYHTISSVLGREGRNISNAQAKRIDQCKDTTAW